MAARVSVTENDLFENEPSDESIWLCTIMPMYVFNVKRNVFLFSHPAPFRWKDICAYVAVKAYEDPEGLDSFYHVFDTGNIGAYVRELKKLFKFLYGFYFIPHARHAAYIQICASAMEAILHLADLERPFYFVRRTIMLLARVLNSVKFRDDTDFYALDAYAATNLNRVSSYTLRNARNRGPVPLPYTQWDFMEILRTL